VFEWIRKFVRREKKPVPSAPSTLKEKTREKYAHLYIGRIIHYYPKIGVGIVRIEKVGLRVGAQIFIQGYKTRFKQRVASIEYNHQKVKEVGPGYEVGIHLGARVRETDDVYVLESS